MTTQLLARSLAVELADFILTRREKFVGVSISVEQAVEQALRSPVPACLLDMGDNVGGGSPGDGTLIAAMRWLRNIFARSSACSIPMRSLRRPAAARIPVSPSAPAGNSTRGTDLLCKLPASSDLSTTASLPTPNRTTAARRASIWEPPQSSRTIADSPSCSRRRVPPFSPLQLTSCGIDPEDYQIVVAKGVHAPVAVYSAACPTLIRVDTPGITTADMRQLPYRFRRKPLFPFETI